MRFRVLHRIYALLNGYFWQSCPICGREFAGHEWKDYHGKPSTIPGPDRVSGSVAICPDCTRAGKGDTGNMVFWR